MAQNHGNQNYGNQNDGNQDYGSYQPPAPQQMSAGEERTWATLSHVVPAIALPLSAGTLGFVASLVVYLLYKDRGPFVRAHAANSLNVQIMTLIYLAISAVLMLVLIGFVLYPLVIVVAIVLHVVGALRANQGEWWSPPLTPGFVR